MRLVIGEPHRDPGEFAVVFVELVDPAPEERQRSGVSKVIRCQGSTGSKTLYSWTDRLPALFQIGEIRP
jgi:hypothetical protein